MQTNVLAHARLAPTAIIIPAFSATLFLSAGLLFLIEPMVAKMVLPRLGGSPAVWSTCLVFFQAVLLLGYAYAHALTRLVSRPVQILVHTAVLLPLAALALPFDLGVGAPLPGQSPALWLLVRLALVAGPPVLAVSATAPLLQRWFADLDHEAGRDPYFLYAGSNAGSLLALVTYPLLVEPTLPLGAQATLWCCGFGALALGVLLCAAATLRGNAYRFETLPHTAFAAASFRERLTWTALAFIPASLLLGVSTYVTTDIAAAPLLWVVPLIVYLLTFVLVFARRPPFRHATMVRLLPLLLIPLVITAAPGRSLAIPLPLMLGLHIGCFFVIGMVCHGELARRRPPAARLTEFYLFLSVGGVLGGAFNALLAPLLFPGPWEYPLALSVACLLRPVAPDESRRGLPGDIMMPLALIGLVMMVRAVLPGAFGGAGRLQILVALAVVGYLLPALALMSFSRRRWRFALGVAGLLLAPIMAAPGGTIASYRSFFGVYRVVLTEGGDGRLLMHGTTLHGAESLLPGEEDMPLTYYSHEGPFGHFFETVTPASIRHVGVVGLGTGSLACYAQPGQDWTFYEIDPVVERIARDPRYFHFLANCGNRPHVVLGDARLTLASVPDYTYDVLVLDAFSSDTIPMHLLTREALALYLRKLAPGGYLLFHISSRALDLRPVVGALAADAGVQARIMFDHPPQDVPLWRRGPTLVVALTGHGGSIDQLRSSDGWTDLRPGGPRSLWTDQRSDILGAIRFGR